MAHDLGAHAWERAAFAGGPVTFNCPLIRQPGRQGCLRSQVAAISHPL